MADQGESNVVHLKAGDQLPTVPYASPTVETLKQLLEQMLENERRRLRNEYIRIAMVFFALLITAAGGGIWFGHSLLKQLRAERQITERSLRALLRQDDLTGDQPAPRADADTVRAQADIKQLMTGLETTKLALADLLKSQNAKTRDLLKTRDSSLQALHERMKEVQNRIMNAEKIEAQPAQKGAALPADSAASIDSLTVRTPNSVTLRLPIPAP